MTLLLTHEEVRSAVTMDDAIDSMEGAFREEGEGKTLLPQRINIKAGTGGWLRVGPVVLEGSGWMGFKAMNLTPGMGVRYQVHLYEIERGALLCIMDAQHLTTLRTGATSAVATRRLARPGKAVTALLGSGPEARAQLDAMVAAGYVSNVRIFSPTEANRERLAAEFRDRGVDARAAGSAEEACADASLILAAVKSTEPVLMGEWLQPGTHVNSVGTARKDQREIDLDVFRRAGRIVVDTRGGVFGEAGDAVAAADLVREADVHELSALVGGDVGGRQNDDQITLFKSVGTGIQDIAVAATIYTKARELGLGTELGEFPYLKSNTK